MALLLKNFKLYDKNIAQEPWPDSDIKRFLLDKYHVTFDIFSKIEINGDNAHPLFKYLKSNLPGAFGE